MRLEQKNGSRSVSLMFLPHIDLFCDLSQNRRTTTWNLFALYNKKMKKLTVALFMRLSLNRSYIATNRNARTIKLFV